MTGEIGKKSANTELAVVPETLDLVVERYVFATKPKKSRQETLRDAARSAESMLYNDIAGALMMDCVLQWGGKSFHNYHVPDEINDGIAKRRPRWHIPPYEYEMGIRWKPADGMQQFDVRVEAVEKEGEYKGLVNMTAYVWDDKQFPGDGRLGCLLDVVDRTRRHMGEDSIVVAETGKISIPMDRNKKENIDHANLNPYGNETHIFGFEFPPDPRYGPAPGDICHSPIVMAPIDLRVIEHACMYRDR